MSYYRYVNLLIKALFWYGDINKTNHLQQSVYVIKTQKEITAAGKDPTKPDTPSPQEMKSFGTL